MKIIKLLILSTALSACATTSPTEHYDCTGLTGLEVLRFSKKSHLFLKHDAQFYERYSMATASAPRMVLVQACRSVNNDENMTTRINMYSDLWSRVRYCTQSVSDSLKTYDTFLNWAKQPVTQRQKTLSQANQQLALVTQCTSSTVPKSEPAWYVDIEQFTQEPLLVSNARDPRLHGAFSNDTVAFTVEDIQQLRNKIFQYGEQK
ncbi:hypothetical protein [Alysiella filiformis]|uniref:Lysozyme inhibitor LprI N-terminal domain-containing protein n=1 Tax=Alysiella filiformis DSM 16848 TaxID=1120981 RepID=A0A286E5W8_9NEIS|nr:hypothetical protein [Alysiella filiformis]QMT30335.1 hypothetical protein H3L97_06075 [Alysiella filiformis]UBQ56689.1 hypothetical protein JF568_02615 [Alysiella filiformis DSM 16848]SOD66261.1 hypothetical protein SAMN02746062_00564 [Alysiella filiformis DSM 16848]